MSNKPTKKVNLGTYIKKFRKDANMSQSVLGEIVGINQSEISRLEAGRGSVSKEIIEAMVIAGVVPEMPPEPSEEIKQNIDLLAYEDQEMLREMMHRMMK